MKKMMNRTLAMLLALLLVVGMVPGKAFAEETQPEQDVKQEEQLEPQDLPDPAKGYVLTAEEIYCMDCAAADAEEGTAHKLDSLTIAVEASEEEGYELAVKFTAAFKHTGGTEATYTGSFYVEDFSCETEVDETISTREVNEQTNAIYLKDAKLTRTAGEHTLGKWAYAGNDQHAADCETCGTVTGACVYGAADCVTAAVCGICSNSKGTDDTRHDYSVWANDGVSHWHVCSRNAEHTSQMMGLCAGGEATCAAKAICETCGLAYGETVSHNCIYTFDGATITETCADGCGHNLTATLQQKSGTSLDYTGNAVEPCEIVYPEGWVGEQVQPTSENYENNVNVGEATCTVPYGDDGSVTCNFNVQAHDLTEIRIDMVQNFTYDGTPKKPAVTVGLKNSDITLVEGEDYTLTYVQITGWYMDVPNEWTENSAFTEAGDYAVLIADGPSDILNTNSGVNNVHNTYTIGKAQPTVTAPKAKELTYNGQVQELVEAGSCEMGTVVYSLAENGEYTEAIPTGTNAGTYTVWYKAEVPEDNTKYTSSTPASIEVTIAKAKLTPSIEGTASKVYDGTTDVTDNKLSIKLSGICGTDAVTATADFAYASANAGTKAVKATNIALNEAAAANYELAANQVTADVGEITRLALDPAKIVIAGIDNPVYTGKEVTAGIGTFTQDGLEVTYDLSGNKATDVGSYTMTATAKGNFEGEMKVSFLVQPDADLIKGLTEANVTSENKEALEKAVEMMEDADLTDIPEETKTQWEAIGTTAEELLEHLEEAEDAASTQDITKAKAITAAKAKDTDKETMTSARDDLEDALDNYATNYTAKEREAMEDEVERLEDIIADITAAEDTIEAIDALTVNSTKAKVEAAQKKYDALTAAQKKIVDNSTDGKLDEMQGLVGNYKITSGNGSRWSKKSGGVLSFTCNGPLSKFTGIRVDGKAVLSKNYTYKEGSTIVTLKSSYLEGLSLGNHTITMRYEDGEVSGTFTIQKEAVTPSTGDQFNIGLWAGIGGVSIVALIALLVIMKKKEKK